MGVLISHSTYAASYVNVSSGGSGDTAGVVSLGKIKPSSSGSTATGNDTLTVHTDCSAGYKVYVSGQNGKTTNLTNQSAEDPTNPSSSDIISASSNTIASPNTLSSNTWGISGNSTDIENHLYAGLPAYSSATSASLVTKSDVTEESTVPIYYGVKADTTLNPGTYSGDILYTVLMDTSCIPYTVEFNPNVEDESEITGEMTAQSILPNSATALTANAYEREGYTFLGWSTTPEGKTGNVTNGIGTTDDVDYDNEAEVTNLTTSGSSITLYAIWEVAPTEYMQNWLSCGKMSEGDTVRLKDTRDNKVYTVKKLPDNKCWMMQNLTIGMDGAKTLTPADTNIDNGTTYYLPPAGKQGSSTINNSNTLTATTVANFTNSSSVDDAHAKTQFRTKDSSIANDSDTGYYNFYTATLGYSFYIDGKTTGTTSGTSTRDICPKGWRLPKVTDGGSTVSSGSPAEFTTLAKAYNTSASWNHPDTASYHYTVDMSIHTGIHDGNAYPLATNTANNYAGYSYAGFWSGASSNASNVGSYGRYWSASVQDATQGYGLHFFASSNIAPQSNSNKNIGLAVRCVSRYDDTTGAMQDFDNSTLVNIGDTTKLVDMRDGKAYTVKKLPDDKVWMMQNLTIGSDGAKILTDADTNINNNTTYYLPPVGKQGSGTIDDSSTLNATDTADFSTSNDNRAKTQFRTKDSSITNDSDTSYYNFYTATLGYSYYQDDKISGTSTRDICPKGWRMPKTTDSGTNIITTDSTNDFTYLARQYGSSTGWSGSATGTNSSSYCNNNNVVNNSIYLSAAYPLSTSVANNYAGFSYSGSWNGYTGSATRVGSYGRYWSASVYDTYSGYQLYIESSNVCPQGAPSKYNGYAVRCIAQNGVTVTFNANGGTGEMGPQRVYENSNLQVNTFTRDGYVFLGWSEDANATTATYADGASASDLVSSGSNIILYAVWGPIDGDMQGWLGCSKMSEGDTAKLKDLRDGTVYSIKKIGNDCWMIDNLILGHDKSYALTSELTNIPSNDDGTLSDNGTYYLPAAGRRGAFNSPTDSGAPTFNGSNDAQAQVQYRARGSSGDQASSGTLDQGTGYYNFYAATLGCSYYNDGNNGSCRSGYVAKDICPKGWQLPTGDNNVTKSWVSLDRALNGSSAGRNRTDATAKDRFLNNANFLYPGIYNSSQLYYVGSYGRWWSSTVGSTYTSYSLSLTSSGDVRPQYGDGRANGFAVRCVAKYNDVDVDTDVDGVMQDFDSSSLTNVGDSAKLVDIRDNKVYTVKKLSDGKVWMIDNLTISATGMVADSLDNTNTNIPSSDTNKYYLPPQNTSYQTAGSINNSAVKTASSAVNFSSSGSYSRYPQVGYRAKNTTDNNTGNPVPENTAYYNFYTASLGYSYYSDNKTSGSSPRDICPKGWRLPWVSDSGSTSTGTGDMYTLALSYNNNSNFWSNYITPGSSSYSNPYTSDATVRQNMVAGDSGSLDRFANNGAAGFTYAGSYNGATLNLVGTDGYYWSSSVYITNFSYSLNFYTTNVYPQGNSSKYVGFAVRCIAGTRS